MTLRCLLLTLVMLSLGVACAYLLGEALDVPETYILHEAR